MDTYEMPWRPNFEIYSTLSWGAAALVGSVVMFTTSMPTLPWAMGVATASAMMLRRGYQAACNAAMRRRLLGSDVRYVPIKELMQRVQKKPDSVYLGKGFMWDQKHTQLVYEINSRNRSDILPRNEKRAGAVWIHGLEKEEADIELPLDYMNLHTLLVGTTGSGKTRSFDLMIAQAICGEMRSSSSILRATRGCSN